MTASKKNDSNHTIQDNHEIEKVLKKLPKEDRDKVISIITSTHFSGPIPRPEILKKYGEIVPEAPRKIIDNSINEAEHRRKFDDMALNATVHENNKRLNLATLVCMTMIICGTVLILNNHEITGGLLAGTTLLGVLGTYLKKNQNTKK
ncbi:DUF2335 domain-containing protein [Companilactobacillus hulinensis]|uniref:DUF2335 domain-containing protein n=1 Tax=Companilactobacillus hulinensis TaxID=2486007 RepID=UPI0013DDBF00|nr:DUF2335 domain-containing protein [Companilactobacillus hulinensis]